MCGGLAEYFDIDPTILRVIAPVSLLVGTAGIWAYIIMRLTVGSGHIAGEGTAELIKRE